MRTTNTTNGTRQGSIPIAGLRQTDLEEFVGKPGKPVKIVKQPGPSPYADFDMSRLAVCVRMVTPALAARFRTEYKYDRQRNLSDLNVKRLVAAMQAAEFLPGTPLFFCKVGKSLYLVNGNHTCQSIIQSGIAVPLVIITYRVDSKEDTDHAYASLDDIKNRTPSDLARALFGNKEGVAFIAKLRPALNILSHDLDPNPRKNEESKYEPFKIYADYQEAAERLFRILGGEDGETPEYASLVERHAPVMAPLLEVLRSAASREKGEAFIKKLVYGHDQERKKLNPEEPAEALRKFLTNMGKKAGAGPRWERFVATMQKWNCEVEGRSGTFVKPNAVKEFKLLLTKWHDGLGSAGRE